MRASSHQKMVSLSNHSLGSHWVGLPGGSSYAPLDTAMRSRPQVFVFRLYAGGFRKGAGPLTLLEIRALIVSHAQLYRVEHAAGIIVMNVATDPIGELPIHVFSLGGPKVQ